jgi:ubiquinone/menaquinone biosynthesis C-methylase UbiE
MSYANAWLKWFDLIEKGASPLSARMIELADLKHAHDVLDIGTGIGEPAVSAALALGRDGRVLAIDRDPEMIAIARARAKEFDVPNIDFHVADVETIDLARYSFDAILARWSLMSAQDKPGVIAKLAEALRPGGHLVAAAWASPSDVPALTLAKKTICDHFGWPDSTYVLPKAFAMSDIGATEQLFIDAGFGNVSTKLLPVVYEFASPALFIQYRLDVAGPLWEGMDKDSEEVKDAAFQAIEEAMQPYRISDNQYRLVNRAYCVSGQIGKTS